MIPCDQTWRRRTSRRAGQAGLSLVELMVGLTVGLFVVAGASLMASNYLTDNRRLMLETQIQQDLRATVDLIVRDIRRAGYWGSAQNGVWTPSGAIIQNPYPAISPESPASAVQTLQYSYSLDDPTENGVLDANENLGIRLRESVVEMRLGANAGWQALTDASTLSITRFDILVRSIPIDLPCMKPCAPGAVDCPRRQSVRNVEIFIVGQAVHDPLVVRSVRSDVRIRNDQVIGACPV